MANKRTMPPGLQAADRSLTSGATGSNPEGQDVNVWRTFCA